MDSFRNPRKNYPWAKDSTSRHWEAEQSVLKDLYDQVAKLLDPLEPLKMDSDDESETGETQRVHSNAANNFKKTHGRSEVRFRI